MLAFGTPKFYIAPYGKIYHGLVKLSNNCEVKSGLNEDTDIVALRYYIKAIINMATEYIVHCFLKMIYCIRPQDRIKRNTSRHMILSKQLIFYETTSIFPLRVLFAFIFLFS